MFAQVTIIIAVSYHPYNYVNDSVNDHERHEMSSPTGHMTLLRRWINVNDVDSTSQQAVGGCHVFHEELIVIYNKLILPGWIMITSNNWHKHTLENTVPVNIIRLPKVGSMLSQHRRRWANNKSTFCERLVFALSYQILRKRIECFFDIYFIDIVVLLLDPSYKMVDRIYVPREDNLFSDTCGRSSRWRIGTALSSTKPSLSFI